MKRSHKIKLTKNYGTHHSDIVKER